MASLVFVGFADVATAQVATSRVDAFRDRLVTFADVRFRFDSASVASRGEASAASVRVRSGFEAPLGPRATALLELEGVAVLGDGPTAGGGRLMFDEPGLEVNRAQVTYDAGPARVIGGRQRLELDDERFVGSAGFRQNEQTFDAVRFVAHPNARVTIDAAYVWQVNRFNQSSLSGNAALLDVGVQLPFGHATVFHHVLDLAGDRRGVRDARASVVTSGVRLRGRHERGGLGIEWRADYAIQRDHGDNPFDYRAAYKRVVVRADTDRLSVGAGMEHLGSDGLRAFQTPLGSNHAFQGSADLFLVTPPQGVEDVWFEATRRLHIVGPLRNVTLLARHHWFESVTTQRPSGVEWNLSAAGSLQGYRLTLEHAAYTAETFGADTERTWFTIARAF
jgi:hypothetical protein